MVLEGEQWVAQADYDLSVAELLYQQEVYRYCVFFCHLALEKLLKAIFVDRTGRGEPPHTHNLNNLARRAGVNLQGYDRFLQEMSRHSISARYPRHDELSGYNMDRAERMLARTQEVYEWLNSRMAS